MQKNTILSLIFISLLYLNTLQAQVNIGGTPKSYECEKTGILIDPPVFVQTAPLDMAAIEAEDTQWEIERALGGTKIGRRFGIEFEVQYDLYNSGAWTYFPDGSELWRLGVECPDALTINLIFDRYHLPAGATLYIYNANKKDMIGGFTNYNNQEDYYFATDIVEGDKIIIEYYQPAHTEFEAELRLGTIVHGYRGTLIHEKGFGGSGSCQRNAVCPEGAGYEDQIRSVCALYKGGTELCSGALIANTANDKTPYVLTANHCLGSSAASTIGTWVFRFRWESTTCTPSTNNSNYKTMSGATLRMKTPTSTTSTDCLLVELNQPIPADYDVYFAGWSRASTAPPSVLIIHHPALDIKKITPSTNVTAVTQYVQGWRANFTVGGPCTEGGSSGSPIFDHNHRIIGQEYGGLSSCTASAANMFDVWGRFDLSWNYGSTAATRLKDWLDPLNLDPTTLDGLNNIPLEPVTDAELLNIIVPEATYYAIGNITPKVTIKNNGNTTITSATVAYTIDSGTPVSQTWTGTLAAGATTDVTFPNITLTYGNHVFTATVTVAGDVNTANNTKTKNYAVLSVDAELLNIIIPEETYYFTENITPKVTIKNNGNTTITSATLSYTIDGGTPVSKAWTGTLAAGATTEVTFNSITLTYGTHVFVATVTVQNDANAANNSKTKNYEVLRIDAELLDIITPEETYYFTENIEPKVTLKNNGEVTLTTATVSYTIDGGTAVYKTWDGTLAVGETTDITFDAITLTYGTHALVANVAVQNDANVDNNDKTKNYEVLRVDAELLDIIAPEETYYFTETIEPKVTLKNNGTVTITSATVSYTIDENTTVSKTWEGTLAVDETTDITFDAITLTYGTHALVANVTVQNDANTANDSKTKNYEVITPACLPVQNLTSEQNENTITINWENPENTEHIKGYAVYMNGTASGIYMASHFILTGETIEAGDYEFCVTALYDYDWCEESPKECVTVTVTSIEELPYNPVKIYPNPAHSQIFVEGAPVKSIEIYNLQGKLLYLQNGNLPSIDVSGFAAGNYLIIVSIENGQKITKQITIRR